MLYSHVTHTAVYSGMKREHYNSCETHARQDYSKYHECNNTINDNSEKSRSFLYRPDETSCILCAKVLSK